MKQACAFTGHRELDPARLEYVKAELRREVLAAIAEGYTHFLCGMASGADLLFASVVVELKKEHGLSLEAALPYPKRAASKDAEFRRLISCCDIVGVHSKAYFPRCFTVRNQFMVQNATRLIAVFDGREKTGTAATIRYARVQALDVHLIIL